MYKVLVVDDEPYMLEGWKTMVEWHAFGYQLCAAASEGREALALADSIKPDVVFTDIRMPGIDGLELIRRIRESLRSKCRIVIMSGFSEFEYVRRAMPYRIERFMLKPLIPDEIHDLLLEFAAEDARGARRSLNQLSGPVAQAVELLQSRYREKLQIAELARTVGHHPVYLGQLFKKETGFAIHEYLHQIRTTEAKRLLCTTNLKIAAIADALGYRDAEAFASKFRAITSMLPSEYRATVRSEHAQQRP